MALAELIPPTSRPQYGSDIAFEEVYHPIRVRAVHVIDSGINTLQALAGTYVPFRGVNSENARQQEQVEVLQLGELPDEFFSDLDEALQNYRR